MIQPPLPRTVKLTVPPTRGLDVDAHARAMHVYLADGQLAAHLKARPAVRETWGVGKRTLAKKAAKKAGLPQYGVFGPALFRELVEAGAYKPGARQLLAQYAESVRRKDPRDMVCDAARFYLEHARHIAYSQARPIATVAHDISPPDIPHALDCSGLAITCYWVAGVAAALGAENAHGYGNTWSLADHGRPIRASELKPGDLVFYGRCSHVAVYIGSSRIVTNGHYPMSLERLTYRSDYFGARSYL